jgi:succinylarginine dihydrolase
MQNGGGPACLRLRVVLTEAELTAAKPELFLDVPLYDRLVAWATSHYREELAPEDLGDPALLSESREALDELTQILELGGRYYAFQRG